MTWKRRGKYAAKLIIIIKLQVDMEQRRGRAAAQGSFQVGTARLVPDCDRDAWASAATVDSRALILRVREMGPHD